MGGQGGPGKTLAAVIPVPRPSIPGMSSPNLQDRAVRTRGQEERSGGGGVHALDRSPCVAQRALAECVQGRTLVGGLWLSPWVAVSLVSRPIWQ